MFILLISVISLLPGGCSGGIRQGGVPLPVRMASAATREMKPALIRLEDIGPGGQYQDEESLEKLRIIAEYLHQEGVPFQIALIPRMVNPAKGYDVGLGDQTAYVRNFVATIKYMESLGGVVGIHGYTHQSAGEASGIGFEFYDRVKNPSVPDNIQYARNRVASAIELFQKAGITPAFWETPHYTASGVQCQAFEEQIGLIYEDNYRGVPYVRPHTTDSIAKGYRGYTTVPTPLGYISTGQDLKKMIENVDNPNGNLASFFYHPFKEFKYITKANGQTGAVHYVYDTASPLHQIINAIKDNGYTFVSIYSLVMFVPAQRVENLPAGEGGAVLAGRFEPGQGKEILLWDRTGNRWDLYRYTAAWYAPREKRAFENRGAWLEGWDQGAGAGLMSGDINGDGLDDLIAYSPARGSFYLAENKGNRFEPLAGKGIPVKISGQIQPLAGDFNGDGLCDLAAIDRGHGKLGVALNVKGEFTQFAWQSVDLLNEKCQQKYLTGDFNGDGRADIAVLDVESGRWHVLLSGERAFSGKEGAWLENWGAGGNWQPVAADVNGDGRCDMVLYSRSGHWQVAVSAGDRFIYSGDFGPWGAGPGGLPMAEDLNGDNRADLILLDGSGGRGYNLDTAISVVGR